LGLDEAAQAEPVRRSGKNTHDIENQVHPAILNNDLGVAALLLELEVYKKLFRERAE
jgi:hypothetical protein